MKSGIQAGGTEGGKERYAESHSPCDESIDVTCHQVVWMFVVAAEHAGKRMLGQQGPEFVEIARRRAFADKDLLSERDLFPSFVDMKTFVVRLDAGFDVGA